MRSVQPISGSVQIAGPQAVNPGAAIAVATGSITDDAVTTDDVGTLSAKLRGIVSILASITDTAAGDTRLRVTTVSESYNFAAWGQPRFAPPLQHNIISPWG